MCFLFMAASGNGHTARKGHDFYIMAGGRFDHGEASSLCRRAGGRLPSSTHQRPIEEWWRSLPTVELEGDFGVPRVQEEWG